MTHEDRRERGEDDCVLPPVHLDRSSDGERAAACRRHADGGRWEVKSLGPVLRQAYRPSAEPIPDDMLRILKSLP